MYSNRHNSYASLDFSQSILHDAESQVEIRAPKRVQTNTLMGNIADSLKQQQQSVKRPAFIIMADNQLKIMWDVFVMCLLILTSFVIPYRLAFVDEETAEWIAVYYCIDFFFLIDLVICFFTSYKDDYRQVDVVSHKKICINYLTGWFLIDLMSVFPFDAIMTKSGGGNSNANSLLRVARIGKIYKIIRLFRLLRILKLVKSNKKLVHHFSEKMKISNGLERLVFFSFFFLIFLHVFACLCVMVTILTGEFSEVKWIDSCAGFGERFENLEQYICSMYFVLTTISTVGYGDIHPQNSIERLFGMVMMITGVLSFTFVSGSLASIMQSHDTREAQVHEKVLQLNKLRVLYPITDDLIQRIRNALNFDANKTDGYLQEIYQDLPTGLKVELMMVVHEA